MSFARPFTDPPIARNLVAKALSLHEFSAQTYSMSAARATFEEADDAAPVEMLCALFEANGWAFEQTVEEEVSVEIPGSWTKYQLRAIWRREDRVLQLLCLPDIRVSDEKRGTAFELLAMINEQLWLGHFDIWSQGGMLLYRHGLMLGDDGMLSIDMAQMAIETAIAESDRFYPAFQFVLWGDKSPEAALDAAMVDAAGEA